LFSLNLQVSFVLGRLEGREEYTKSPGKLQRWRCETERELIVFLYCYAALQIADSGVKCGIECKV